MAVWLVGWLAGWWVGCAAGLAGSGVRGWTPFLSLVVVCRETKDLATTSLLTNRCVNSAFLVVAKMRPQSLWSIRNAVLTDPAKTSSPRVLGVRVCRALLPAASSQGHLGGEGHAARPFGGRPYEATKCAAAPRSPGVLESRRWQERGAEPKS